ncbi:MAG: hypothetical protein HOE90_12840 [Bacteriovoracaceae bacterium]|jgi:hypothetical protein|nr:hypothetical protein [Bacteriovoracaceae bacterium]
MEKVICSVFILLLGVFASFSANAEEVEPLLNWKATAKENLSLKDWILTNDKESIRREKINYYLNGGEIVGRVISCIGDCRIYRGEGFARASYRSTIKEGDDLFTLNDSFMWVYLLNGTMVRMAPYTSVSLKEINLSLTETFVHVRINQGAVHWIARQPDPYQINNLHETDRVFLPLRPLEANPYESKYDISEDNLAGLINEDQRISNHIENLNKKIAKNDKGIPKRRHFSFIVFAGGTVFGENVTGQFYSLLGEKTFLKLSEPKKAYHLETVTRDKDYIDSLYFYRGYQNRDTFDLDEGVWYEVSEDGRTISENPKVAQIMNFSDFVVSRIPSIMTAREIFYEKYSRPILVHNDPETFPEETDYFLWGGIKDDDIEVSLANRLKFLFEHTRRTETNNLSKLRSIKHLYRNTNARILKNVSQFFHGKVIEDYVRHLNYYSDSSSKDYWVRGNKLKKKWLLQRYLKGR